MMHIVIHRKLGLDAAHAYADMYTKLVEKYGRLVRGRQNGKIEIGDDIRISFFAGEPWRMSGIRVNIYNTNDRDTDEFLMMSASKVNGVSMSMDDILKTLLEEEVTNV